MGGRFCLTSLPAFSAVDIAEYSHNCGEDECCQTNGKKGTVKAVKSHASPSDFWNVVDTSMVLLQGRSD